MLSVLQFHDTKLIFDTIIYDYAFYSNNEYHFHNDISYACLFLIYTKTNE